jgi:hypothetical protein
LNRKTIWSFKYVKFAGKKEQKDKTQLLQEPTNSLENLLTALLITNAFCPYRPRSFFAIFTIPSILVAARSKAWVCARSLAGNGGSDPAWGVEICLS